MINSTARREINLAQVLCIVSKKHEGPPSALLFALVTVGALHRDNDAVLGVIPPSVVLFRSSVRQN